MPATFITEYWGRKALFIKGQPDKAEKLFGVMFDRDGFFRAVQRTARRGGKDFSLYAGTSPRLLPSSEEPSQPIFPIRVDQLEAKFADGHSIVAQNLDERGLATCAAALKAQLGHAGKVQVHATLTPEGGKHGAHIDPTCGIFVHCEGRKRFLISAEPILSWPCDSAILTADGAGEYNRHTPEDWEEISDVDMTSLKEVVMEPGDVLYIPAGTIHATEAIGGGSVGVHLQFVHANFLDLIRPVLERVLMRNPAWRHLPAEGPANTMPGELPAEVKRFFAKRLEELRQTLNALTPAGLELNYEWHKLMANPGEATLESLVLDGDKSSDRPIQRKDVLSLSKRVPVTYAIGTDSDGDTIFHLFYDTKEVSASGEWVNFLKTLIAQPRFVAESAVAWAPGGQSDPWETVQDFLQVLLDHGILQHERT
jgi:hypothetical protein